MTLGKNGSRASKRQEAELKKTQKTNFPVVAIGASAGGLEAFALFFKNLEVNTGMAYVVITHLDRNHVSMMAELIKKYTPMQVFTIADGVRVMPNKVYVIPPRKNVALIDDLLTLVEQAEPHYSNLPIDFFFRSLALDRAENAAAVILSGAGADGSLGARDIKLSGGIVIAQEPTTAKFNSMPNSVINSGFVDFIMPPDKIGEQLIEWSNYGNVANETISLELPHLFSIIRSHTGYDFSSYKLNTIYRRIEKQMLTHHLKSLTDYITLLKQNPKEVNILFKSLLIGVTHFFRDSEAFDLLKQDILPGIFDKKPLDYCLRVWVPGCSTGEEVYSIAMIIAEYMQEKGQHYYVQIFGTDIDRNALVIARRGIYPAMIANEVKPERLQRFFTQENNSYKINKEIRSMVIFGEQNIIKDPPFTKVDIISCRNVLIYLNAKLQKKILPVFHYSLKPKGILFLGMSESISGYNHLFESRSKKAKFFEVKNSAVPPTIKSFFPEISYSEATTLANEKTISTENSLNNAILKKILLEKFLSPCLVIDKKGVILFCNGNVNKYIRYAPALEGSNISSIIPHAVMLKLKSAIDIVFSKNREVIYYELQLNNNGDIYTLNLRVLPLVEMNFLHDMALIVFEEITSAENIKDKNAQGKLKKENKNELIENLERDLHNTKENLQASIEELESSNEELQSMNEELQSSNEELETSKEELHSLNEELVVMNTELQSRIDQLAIIHADMTNLFNSTEVATFFLDSKLCIRRFTPKAQEFIPVINTDIGRSIRHFSTTIKYEKLVEDAEEVLKTLNQKTIKVQNKSDKWFLIRIIPYRTLSNIIDGVVITFTDITEHKEAEKTLTKLNDALQNALICSKNILDTVMTPLLVLTMNLKILSANRAFYKNFHFLPEDIIDNFIYKIPDWNTQGLREVLEQNFPESNLFEGFEIETIFPKNKSIKITINARKIFNNQYGADVLLLAMEPQ